MPMSRDIMPTRPRNIAVLRRILEASESSGVTPNDDPTVNRAEIAS
jgi:hypothetical protein